MSEAKEVIIVSSDEVAGRRITSVLGLVRGNSVRARNLVRDIQALGRTVVGGRIGVYAELLEESREEALAKISVRGRNHRTVVAP